MIFEPPPDINAYNKIGEIKAGPVYLSYPTIYQRHLIPDREFAILNERWSTERYPVPNTEFFMLENVFVASEGLVFSQNFELIKETKTAHSTEAVEKARDQLRSAQNTIRSYPKAVLCKKRGAANFGHWLAEMLPKAYWSARVKAIHDWPVVIHKTSDAVTKIVKESLNTVGIPLDRIIETGEEPVFFEKLIIVEGLTSHAVYISPIVFECMEFIASKAPAGTMDSIYVTRKPVSTRDFEDEALAKNIFASYGYQECVAADLSFLEQVGMFKSAKRLVGAMGAAFSNTLFCRPGSNILLFAPASALELFFWHIASVKKLNYNEIRCMEVGEQKGPLPWDRALKISETAIHNVMRNNALTRNIPALILDGAGAPTSSGNLDLDDVIGRWEWVFNNDTQNPRIVTLLADGKISGYQHENEASWRISEGFLEILSTHGLCSWRFEDINRTAGNLSMRAIFRRDASVRAILTCRKSPD